MENSIILRAEYPRPQMKRDSWINLNGVWMFEIDNGKSGYSRGLVEAESLIGEILVPFCPESRLSGVENLDFMECVWYKRTFSVPSAWLASGRKTLIHIGASDYLTEVWVNGYCVGKHRGGYASFSFDVTEYLQEENCLTIVVTDETRSGNQPVGKQSKAYYSEGCSYTRVTGIWQTVWAENVPESYIAHTKYTPFPHRGVILVEADCCAAHGKTLKARASYEGRTVGDAVCRVSGRSAAVEIQLEELYLWEPESPCLYDLTLTLEEDIVESYFGLREMVYDNGCFLLNGQPIFQRLILDQGYYQDGIYTAPSDEELKADILRSKAMGFNGARLHQKVFEPRFLYHCDTLGYLVWGEEGDWGLDTSRPEAWRAMLPEWLEILRRDYNHPALIGWCALNETQSNQDPELVKMLVDLTRAYDGIRPVIDASGWKHEGTLSDILDVHDYEQDATVFSQKMEDLLNGNPADFFTTGRCRPTFISEYGGIWWSDTEEGGWGYGERPATREEALERFRRLTATLLNCPVIAGFCYTQLTDVEQEKNGLYTYDRHPKFDSAAIAEIVGASAAIEKDRARVFREKI